MVRAHFLGIAGAFLMRVKIVVVSPGEWEGRMLFGMVDGRTVSAVDHNGRVDELMGFGRWSFVTV